MTEFCCIRVAKAVEDPRIPLEFDSELSEYQICLRTSGYSIINFCPFCGRPFPPSGRSALFLDPDPEEIADVGRLTQIQDITDLQTILGPPSEVLPCVKWTQYRFSGKWKSIELIIQQQSDGRLEFIAVPKRIP